MSSVILCILDGWGTRTDETDNGLKPAKHWHEILNTFPNTIVQASEDYVGLPHGQMGNSEVGHMTIGLGRVLEQDLPKLNRACAQNAWGSLPRVIELVKNLQNTQKTCHLMGLFSSGGVHSHKDHFISVARFLLSKGIQVALHIFLDGRDTPPQSAIDEVQSLEELLNAGAKLASISGRYYAMDRDIRWDRTALAYKAIALGQSDNHFEDAKTYIQSMYDQGKTDEFIPPAVCSEYQGVEEDDAIWHINFRADRVRQLYEAFVVKKFSDFERGDRLQLSAALGMSSYSELLDDYVQTVFEKPKLHDSLGEVISNKGLKQLRVAETEKYAHVTFFFNGGREDPFEGEERCLVPSPRVATYDQAPEMSAPEVCDKVCEAIESGEYSFIVVNFANTDMVGHTGVQKAIYRAVECVDECVWDIAQAAQKHNATLIITADHGNAEEMVDSEGRPHTAHTCNPVPFVVVGSSQSLKLRNNGTLADVAPTVLHVLGIPKPDNMTGRSLCE